MGIIIEETTTTTIETVTRLSAYSGIFMDGISRMQSATEKPETDENDKPEKKESE